MRTVGYRLEHCKKCIAAGAKGYSLTAFAGTLNVSREKLDHWAERYPSFCQAVGVHKAKRAKFWEDQLARIARDGGKTGSTTMVMLALKSIADEDIGSAKDEGPDHHTTEHVLSDDSAEKLKDILA